MVEENDPYSCLMSTPEGKEMIELERDEEVEIMGGKGKLKVERGDLVYKSQDGEVDVFYLDGITMGLNKFSEEKVHVDDEEVYKIDLGEGFSLEPSPEEKY